MTLYVCTSCRTEAMLIFAYVFTPASAAKPKGTGWSLAASSAASEREYMGTHHKSVGKCAMIMMYYMTKSLDNV